MAHLQASSRYLALLLCFVPVLALSQQPMSVGVKGYATAMTFAERGDFGMTTQAEPTVSFTNTMVTGFGIYFERKSPLGFQWALEVGRLFEKHVVHVEELGPVPSVEVPIYLASAQFGYRFRVGTKFSIAGFTGASYQFLPSMVAGIGHIQTKGDYEFAIFQSFTNVLYLPLRLDAAWAMSDRWNVAADIQASLPMDMSIWPNGYYIRITDTQGSNPPRTANYTARQYPIIFSIGLHYKLQ